MPTDISRGARLMLAPGTPWRPLSSAFDPTERRRLASILFVAGLVICLIGIVGRLTRDVDNLSGDPSDCLFTVIGDVSICIHAPRPMDSGRREERP